jgi:predicted sulfurtransferase
MENADTAAMESDSEENWQILLFYQYCDLIHPTTTCSQQQEVCSRLNLRGRIRVSPEGINGTLGGSCHSVSSYITIMNEIPEFNAVERPIHWKLGSLSEIQMTTKTDYKFKSLSVKVVKEVVSLDLSETETEKMIQGTALTGDLPILIPLNVFHILTSALTFFIKLVLEGT